MNVARPRASLLVIRLQRGAPGAILRSCARIHLRLLAARAISCRTVRICLSLCLVLCGGARFRAFRHFSCPASIMTVCLPRMPRDILEWIPFRRGVL